MTHIILKYTIYFRCAYYTNSKYFFIVRIVIVLQHCVLCILYKFKVHLICSIKYLYFFKTNNEVFLYIMTGNWISIKLVCRQHKHIVHTSFNLIIANIHSVHSFQYDIVRNVLHFKRIDLLYIGILFYICLLSSLPHFCL